MNMARIKSSHTDKQGRRRDYASRLLRRTYREDGKVRDETLANLTKLPDHVVDAVEAALKGDALATAKGAPGTVTITRSLPHGHVAAACAMAAKLGLPGLLGPACPHRDLALALIVSRVARPGSKLPALAWWADTPLGIDDATTDDAYAAMDWPQTRQDAIEKRLAGRYLAPQANPRRMALFDLSSSWLEGTHCPLEARGYSRDGKKGKVQIEYGLLTDPRAPVAVRVFEGSAADPAAFTAIADVVDKAFRLRKMVMVGDCAMITSARIEALRELDDKYTSITALRSPAIRKLMAGDGPLQLSPFDGQDLAEVTSDNFPGDRLVACRNPALADERARKREALLAATGKLLAPIAARVAAGRLSGADRIGTAVGKVIGKYKMAKHLDVTITDASLAVERRQDHIPEDPLLDGIYVIRTPSPPKPSTPPQRSPPTRASSTSSANSGTSNPTTWT
jgi:hypothetical protein